MSQSIYSFDVKNIQGDIVSLEQYKGKVLLIVNTASKCGFTPQYDGLQALYEEYHEKGLEILAFPCNQFGAQEQGTNTQINDFCSLTFDVKFPMFAKIDVNGDKATPMYEYLKAQAPGILGSKSIKWNFTKFLVGRDGKVIRRASPKTKPASLLDDIKLALQ